VKIRQREAVAQPQVQEDEFALRGGLIDRLGAGLRVRALFDRRNVTPREFFVPPSPAAMTVARITVRARADSKVSLAAPVRQVVASLVAGCRVVGDFVHRITAPRNFLAHRLIHRGLLVARKLLDSPALQVREKRGAFFEGQVIR
jgi:hypothetical protein